jgi:hypothetical protein
MDVSKRICIWALCSDDDGGYCDAFAGTQSYLDCKRCASSPSKLNWINGKNVAPNEMLPVCITTTVTRDILSQSYERL